MNNFHKILTNISLREFDIKRNMLKKLLEKRRSNQQIKEKEVYDDKQWRKWNHDRNKFREYYELPIGTESEDKKGRQNS
jgi:hypothetical protein